MKSYIIQGVIVSGLMLSVATSLGAQTPFSSAVDRIVAYSPKVRASVQSARSGRLELQMSNRLADPELEGGYQWGQAGVGDKWEVSVTQNFDWPGIYGARSRAIGYQSDALQALAAATESDVRVEAANSLIDYVWASRKAELAEAVLSQMQTLETSYEKAFNHGEATILDVNKTRLTRIDASRNHVAALSYLAAVRASVHTLAPELDVDSLLATVTDFPVQRMYSLSQYQDAEVRNNPQLRSLALSADAASANVSVARRSVIPGFRIGYSHVCELGDHFNGVSFGFNLPVFSTRHKVAAAQAAANAADLELWQGQSAVIARTGSLYAQAQALADEIGSYGSVATDPRPVKLLRQALDGGEINLLTYLQEVSYFNEAAMNYLDLQKEYHTILVTLNRYMPAE